MYHFLSLSQSTVYTQKNLEKDYQSKADNIIQRCPKGFSSKEKRDDYSIKHRIYYQDLPTDFYITIQGQILYSDEYTTQMTTIEEMITHLSSTGDF